MPAWVEDGEHLPSAPDQHRLGDIGTVSHLRDGHTYFEYRDGIRLAVDAGGGRISADWPERYCVDDAVAYMLGLPFAVLLRRLGNFSLHGAAVVIEGRAVGFIGIGGAGKSTIAASFAKSGHQVLTDDLIALSDVDGEAMVESGPSSIRLWPQSVQGLFGDENALPRIVPGWDKRHLDLLKDDLLCVEPTRLAEIFMIDRRSARATTFGDVSRSDAMLSLVQNAFAARLAGPAERRENFAMSERLMSRVRISRISVAEGWSGVESLPAEVARFISEEAPVVPASS
jgi:hypothetical protein